MGSASLGLGRSFGGFGLYERGRETEKERGERDENKREIEIELSCRPNRKESSDLGSLPRTCLRAHPWHVRLTMRARENVRSCDSAVS